MVLLHFFLAKLARRDGKSTSQVCLRFKASGSSTAGGDSLTASEPLLSAFCFPLGPESVLPKERLASEEYTFTLTHGDGSRFQGFCRSVLPPAPRLGSKLRYPQVLCVISEYPWCTFYFTVLQALEQLLRADTGLDTDLAELPAGCMAGVFLNNLAGRLASDPSPGQLLQVPLPPAAASLLGMSPPLRADGSALYRDDAVTLPVPPDVGNGRANCGVPLARLLWHVPVAALPTLIAAMLLERRIVMTSRSRDTVTAAVQAAGALLYPFKWHHIFLPLLPKLAKDYLQAPMPFMVGLPDQMLGVLRGMHGMDEVTFVDLDQGKVFPNWTPASAGAAAPAPGDDASLLPWREELEAALAAAYGALRSPTEYEHSSPFIAGIMQEYFLKLLGSYRGFVHEDTPALNARFASAAQQQQLAQQGQGSPSAGVPSSGSSSAMSSPSQAHKRDGRGAGSSGAGFASGGGGDAKGEDPWIRGHGLTFEQGAFVAQHRRNDKARAFLTKLRHSQLYEMFIQERLQMAAERREHDDPFELRLDMYQERRRGAAMTYHRHSVAHTPSSGQQPASGKLAAMFSRHRRSGSDDMPALPPGALDPAMRRITTAPHLQSRDSAGAPGGGAGLPDPASFFESPSGVVDPVEYWRGGVAGGAGGGLRDGLFAGPELSMHSVSGRLERVSGTGSAAGRAAGPSSGPIGLMGAVAVRAAGPSSGPVGSTQGAASGGGLGAETAATSRAQAPAVLPAREDEGKGAMHQLGAANAFARGSAPAALLQSPGTSKSGGAANGAAAGSASSSVADLAGASGASPTVVHSHTPSLPVVTEGVPWTTLPAEAAPQPILQPGPVGGSGQAVGTGGPSAASVSVPEARRDDASTAAAGTAAAGAAAAMVISRPMDPQQQQQQHGGMLGLQSSKKHLEAATRAAKGIWNQASAAAQQVKKGGEQAMSAVGHAVANSVGAGERRVSATSEGTPGQSPSRSVSGSGSPDLPEWPSSGGQAQRSADGKPAGLLQRYMPHGGGGGGVMHSLLEGTRLKRPPAPVRPLQHSSMPLTSSETTAAAAEAASDQQHARGSTPPSSSQQQQQQPGSSPGWDPFGLS